ncbi:hypothetical protein ACFQZZ_00360 [Nocardia sp. GCM10030253]|uniref:hypothetical protein n=1 Tax=Nocardia sp. GCM10030253 TaxID=3273404 RepID=UPI003625172E
MSEYADEVRISIAVLNGLATAEPTERVYVVFRPGGEGVDRPEVASGLLAAFPGPDYTLKEQYNITHWGASGAVVEFAMQIAEGTVANLVTGGVIGGVGVLLLKLGLTRGNDGPYAPIAEQEAISEARRHLQRLGAPSFEPADVIAQQSPDGRCVTLEITDSTGHTSTIEVRKSQGPIAAYIFYTP